MHFTFNCIISYKFDYEKPCDAKPYGCGAYA